MRDACWKPQSSPLDLPSATFGGQTGFASATASVSGRSSNIKAAASQRVAVLIPAFRPGHGLIGLVRELHAAGWQHVVVVDDGSGEPYAPLFREASLIPGVTVVDHAINLGKGAALKTGINAILCQDPEVAGIVTLDADGQHDPSDAARVRDKFLGHPDSLILGVRQFQAGVPLRSRLGNLVTRGALRTFVGRSLTDTQTGLRAIPRQLLPKLLKTAASGYEFELEMLIAAKHLGMTILEQPIRTIYEPGNPTSHFQPFLDSMRIYSVLLRFTTISIVTAVLDNLLFFLAFQFTGIVGWSQFSGRLAAMLFNYTAIRKAVFFSGERHAIVLPRYLLVVAINAFLSYLGIRQLSEALGFPVIPAKVLIESLLFLANFMLQRDFVFTKRKAAHEHQATDWDRYYRSPAVSARFTRQYTQAQLLRALRRHCGTGIRMVEVGGANSCFLDAILKEIRPARYTVIDRNRYGLSLLAGRLGTNSVVELREADVLSLKPAATEDAVMSIGLIEHFTPPGTRAAIDAHFQLLRPGGHAILTFPTPTLLYRLTRGVAELLGIWRFPDERPLEREEVAAVVETHGEIVFEKLLWPLVLTQRLMVVRKSTP